jgi:cyclopropane-fatty-acyl-phospholipid synthase
VSVKTVDMNDFNPARRFDRIVSVEMFEHMRNVGLLMRRAHGWLKPGGKLFVHIFCHRELAYLFETEGAANWMGRHFFTGGMMPSEDLLPRLDHGLELEQSWRVNGVHYEKTLRAWLANTDRAKREVLTIFRKTYGTQARRWFGRWRIFFLACAELFGYRNGEEWYVSHYLFSPSKGG